MTVVPKDPDACGGAQDWCILLRMKMPDVDIREDGMRYALRLLLILVIGLTLSACQSDDTDAAALGAIVIETASAKAQLTRQATLQTPPPTPITPSPTAPLVTDTPVPSETPTPSVPIVQADYNAYVRTGPDETFESIDFFLQGQTAEVVGRYTNEATGTWWYIQRIDTGRDGWVWSGAVTLSGDENTIPFIDPPAFPDS